MRSVIVTGDAGALPLRRSDGPKKSSTFNICCTGACSGQDEKEKETSLKPIARRSIQKNPTLKSRPPNQPWIWSHDVVAAYTNTAAMKKLDYVPGQRNASPKQKPSLKSSGGHQRSNSGLYGGAEAKASQGMMSNQMQQNTSQLAMAQQDWDAHERIGHKYNLVFDQLMKKGKARLDQQFTNKNNSLHFQQSANFQNQYRYQLELMRQRIKFDVAWQIFDEVNEGNDTLQHSDLSCLDYEDAVIIAKQKIYELAKHASLQGHLTTEPFVINVKCAEDHLILMEDEYGRTPLKNCVLEMVQKELCFDHHYVSTLRTVLVKVDHASLKKFDEIHRQQQKA